MSGVPFTISESYSDSPGVDARGALARQFPDGTSGWVGIHSSSVSVQFYVTVAARHNPSDLIYPFWHVRWNLRARYFHVRHLHAYIESHRDESCYHADIVGSLQSAHDMGAHGYVHGPRPHEVPANQAQTESEEWMSSCPEP